MIVLDANVLIAFFDASDAHHVAAQELITQPQDPLAMNTLNLAEVLVAAVGKGRGSDVRDMVHALDVHELPIAADRALSLAVLRHATKLRMPDCCVILSSEEHDAAIATFDTRLARIGRERGIRVLSTG